MTKDLVEKEVQLYMSDISSKKKTFLKSESWDKSFGEKGNSKKKKKKNIWRKFMKDFTNVTLVTNTLAASLTKKVITKQFMKILKLINVTLVKKFFGEKTCAWKYKIKIQISMWDICEKKFST